MTTPLEELELDAVKIDLTEQEKKDLKDAFNLFDTDGNGTIDVQEMKAALDAMGFEASGGDTIYQMIGQIDTDGSGAVDLQEFTEFFSRQVVKVHTRKSVREIFDMFDVEGKGYITKDDIEEVAHDLGDYVDPKEAGLAFAQVNTSKTGLISFQEFYSVYVKGKFAMAV